MPDEVALNAAIDAYAEQAYGSQTDGGELSVERSLSLDAYAGKNIDEAPEGRSQVTDRSGFEAVQWIMPSLMRIFAGGDNVVEFDPIGPEDEDVAEQESDYLNYLVTQRNDWDLTVREWCQDALITKNSYCMVSMQEKLNPEIEKYIGQSEEQITILMDDDPEIVSGNQYDDPEDDGIPIHPMTGQPVQDEQQMQEAMAVYELQGIEPQVQKRQLFDIELRITKPKKELVFNVLPPERCRTGHDTPDFTLEDCNFFEYWDLIPISDLRKEGYEIPDDISDDPYTETDEDSSRDEAYEGTLENETPDPSMRQVLVRYIWVRYDYDGDGIAELQYVVRVGSTILKREEVTRIPVACIVPFINTHRHLGMSVMDLMFDIQRIKTDLLRGGLDGMRTALNPGHAVSDKVNLNDMLISRPNRIVRLKDGAVPGEGHVMPLQSENTFPVALQGLQHMDTVTEARVGVNRIFQGIDASNVNDHDRIGQLSTMAAQRVEDIARVFGMGFKRLFALAHELVIKSGHSGEAIKLRGQWVNIDPTQWRTGRDMRVVAPFAAGNKDSLVQRLMVHMQVHEKALAAGLPIVDASDAYELALMLAKATDVSGTKIYTDPTTVEPPEPGPDYTMMALEVEKQKADNAAADSQLDAQVKAAEIESDERTKELVARIQSDTQIALAQINNGTKIDLEQFKSDIKNAPVELGNKAIQATGQAVDQLNLVVAQSIGQVTEALAELKTISESPVKIVRKDGKIVGKEQGGRFTALEDKR